MDTTTIIASAVGGVPALMAAWFAYKSSVRANASTVEANRLASTKVDAEAYERSQKFYDSLLVEAERQLERLRGQTDRLNDQVDRLNTQLASEQDVSNVLRDQVRALTAQIRAMESSLNDLRGQLQGRNRAGIPPFRSSPSSAPRDQ